MNRILLSFAPFAVGQIAAFASMLLLTRRLSAEEYGRFTASVAFQSYVVLLGSAGIKTLVLQEASQGAASRARLFASHFVLTALAGTVALVLSQCSVPFLFGGADPERHAHIWLGVGGWFAIVSVAPFLDAAGRQPVAQSVTAATEAAFLVALVAAGTRLTEGLAAALLGTKWAVASLLAAAAWVAIEGWPGWSWSRDETMRLAGRGFPLLLTSLVSMWPISGTVILVRRWSGVEDAAVAGVASQAAALYLLMAGVAYRLIQPLLSGEAGQSAPDRRSGVGTVVWAMVAAWGAMLGAVAVMFLFLLPEHYRAGTAAGLTMMASALFGAASYLGWARLVARNDETWVLNAYLAGNAVFLALSWATIPHWGPLGAAAASCAGTATTAITMALRLRTAVRH